MKRKCWFVAVLTAAILLLSAFPAFAESGWKQDKFGWWYENEDGSYPASAWRQMDGAWYYFYDSGYMAIGPLKLGETLYYLHSSGVMASGEWVELREEWYYFNVEGSMAKSCWIDDIYYVDKNGAMVRDKKIDGRYIDENGEGEHPESFFP